MRLSNLSLLAAASTQVTAQTPTPSSVTPETGKLGDAAQVIDNPAGVVYKAVLPESAFFQPAYPNGDNLKGEVTAVANDDGLGVRFTLKLSNVPKIGASLPYHLHVNPVPENGNCTATLAHLDPYIRGEATSCDAAAPETCQVGDLSGKHGSIPTDQDAWEASYVDLYASTAEGIGAFFGNRSIVFHYPNKTRITCANFFKVEDGGSSSSSSSSASSCPCGTATLPVSPSHTATPTAGPTHGIGSNSTVPTNTQPPASTTTGVVIGAAPGLRAGIAGAVVFGAAVVFIL